MKQLGMVLSLGLFAGCAANGPGDRWIPVTDHNQLGVVALQVEQSTTDGETQFALHGFDAANLEVGSVLMHVGTIAGLDNVLPGGGLIGSEITLAAGGDETRLVSREVDYHRLLGSPNAAIQAFVELPAVAATLAQQANIHIDQVTSTESDLQYPPQTYNCPASYVLTSPVAAQCCWQPPNPNLNQTVGSTLFINPSFKLIGRAGPSTPCTAQNGGSCAGAACFYGPAGFARPTVGASGYPNYRIVSRAYFPNTPAYCFPDNYSTPPPAIEFPNLTGTQPTGQGCPGGSSGAGQWDYPY